MRTARAFYEYHAALMEPWDGPAAMCFSDGLHIGATLDRNGLRPARYFVTEDDEVVMASGSRRAAHPGRKDQTEVAPAAGQDAADRSEAGRASSPTRRSSRSSPTPTPTSSGCGRTQIVLEELPAVHFEPKTSDVPLLDRQQAFGYTQEDLKLILPPMAATGQEAVGSMGTDTPISALSNKSKLLYSYFKQNFAQVTNPPIDSIREELVMSLVSFIGPRPNVLDLDRRRQAPAPRSAPADPHQRGSGKDPRHRRHGGQPVPVRRRWTSPIRWPKAPRAWRRALDQLFSDAEMAVHSGDNIIILSDRGMSRERVAIPAAARHGGRAPSPDPQGPPHLGGPRGRNRRSARNPPFLRSCRLRRRGDQPRTWRSRRWSAMKPGPAGRARRRARSSIATSRRSVRAS